MANAVLAPQMAQAAALRAPTVGTSAFSPPPPGGGFRPISSQAVPTPPPQWTPYQAPVRGLTAGSNNIGQTALNNLNPTSRTAINSILPGAGSMGLDPLGVFGHSTFNAQSLVDPAGLFGGGERLRANIDPTAGTVDVKHKGQKWDDAFTNYLRTGQGWPDIRGHGSGKIRKQIDALRASGWQYKDPNAPAPDPSAPAWTPGWRPINGSGG